MHPEGSFVCSVYTSVARIPVANALVRITSSSEKPELLALRLTDRSGKTPPITIPTPPADDTTSPGHPQGWTEVDIAVDHPDYIRFQIKNVQIFPGQLTLQNVELVPLPFGSVRQNEQQQFAQQAQDLQEV